jgi:hypothetical protein
MELGGNIERWGDNFELKRNLPWMRDNLLPTEVAEVPVLPGLEVGTGAFELAQERKVSVERLITKMHDVTGDFPTVSRETPSTVSSLTAVLVHPVYWRILSLSGTSIFLKKSQAPASF